MKKNQNIRYNNLTRACKKGEFESDWCGKKKPQKRTEEVCFGSPVKHNKTKKQAKIDDIYKLATSVKKIVQLNRYVQNWQIDKLTEQTHLISS